MTTDNPYADIDDGTPTPNIWDDVRQFQLAAEQHLAPYPGFPNGDITMSFGLLVASLQPILHTLHNTPVQNERELRIKILLEEMGEYIQAELTDDLVGVADGLTDIHYIAAGTENSYGFHGAKHWNEIQGSNMSKSVNGVMTKNEDGKVMKPDSYYRPNLQQFL